MVADDGSAALAPHRRWRRAAPEAGVPSRPRSALSLAPRPRAAASPSASAVPDGDRPSSGGGRPGFRCPPAPKHRGRPLDRSDRTATPSDVLAARSTATCRAQRRAARRRTIEASRADEDRHARRDARSRLAEVRKALKIEDVAVVGVRAKPGSAPPRRHGLAHAAVRSE